VPKGFRRPANGGDGHVSLLSNEVELLRRIPLFAGIDPGKLKLLAYTSDVVTYEPGQVLVRKDDAGDAAYVIITGDAEVTVPANSGNITVAELHDGDFFGEIAILCDTPRTATVTAKGELKALRIRKEPFFQLLHQFPEMAVSLTRLLAERLTRTTAELVEAQQDHKSA
jgi:CRP/FNR family cyclic AMP-dependent transcriptional regulator